MRLVPLIMIFMLTLSSQGFTEEPSEVEQSPQSVIEKFLQEKDAPLTTSLEKITKIERTVKEGVLESSHREEILNTVKDLATKDALKLQLLLIDQIRIHVDARELPTLLGFKSMIELTLANVIQKPESFKTIRAKTNLVIVFGTSNTFFEDIVAEITAVKVAMIQAVVLDNIAKNMEFDEALRPTVTESSFSQLHRLMVDLTKRDLDPAMKDKIVQLIPDLGRIVASAKQGDSKPVFDESVAVCEKVRALYPDFMTLPMENKAYQVAQEIKSLTELFVRHAGLFQE